MIFAASAFHVFHRYLGIAAMFGIDAIWILPYPFNINNHVNILPFAFCISVIPFALIEKNLIAIAGRTTEHIDFHSM